MYILLEYIAVGNNFKKQIRLLQGQALERRLFFLVLLKFYDRACFFNGIFFIHVCLMPAMHFGKMYMQPSVSLWLWSVG